MIPSTQSSDESDSDTIELKINRSRFLDQETYDNLIKYKSNVPFDDLSLKKKIRKLSYTFDFEDDNTTLEWPKGKRIYKIIKKKIK